jgi:hypothetical protein
MIARDIENALARYLSSESDSSAGGLHLFKTQSGAGSPLEIRTGHDESVELPDSGFVLCSCADESLNQQAYGVDCYSATAHVELIYPGDNRTDDDATLPSFDACLNELRHALTATNLADLLTAQGEGVIVLGFSGGTSSTTSINGRLRTATWSFPFLLAAAEKVI